METSILDMDQLKVLSVRIGQDSDNIVWVCWIRDKYSLKNWGQVIRLKILAVR
jgi:hypothetical protein